MMFSGTAAMDLQIKLGRCGKFIVAPRNDIQQMDNVARADEDTLLIVFSDSGQYLNRYDAIEDFYDKGIFNTTKAKTVLITSDEKWPMTPAWPTASCSTGAVMCTPTARHFPSLRI